MVAAATANSGDERARSLGESEGEEGRPRESEREVWGGAWRRVGHPGDGRGEDRQAGGVAPMRAGGERVPLVHLAPGGRRLALPVGWAGLLGHWARPGCTGKFFSIFVFFSIF